MKDVGLHGRIRRWWLTTSGTAAARCCVAHWTPRARHVTRDMLIAAVHALADLAREHVPREVLAAYNLAHLEFGPGYILPKPLDPRLIERVAPAVAGAWKG
jgi:malic enzyme